MFVGREAFSYRIKTIKSIPRCKPHRACVIDENSQHSIVAEAVGIRWIMTVGLELATLEIETDQPMAKGAKPESGTVVFQNCKNIGGDSTPRWLVKGALS